LFVFYYILKFQLLIRMKRGKLTLKTHSDKLSVLLDKITDLTKIKDILRIKIDPVDIVIYSAVGESILLAFKNHTIKTADIFTGDIDKDIDGVILNPKKFVKNLEFLTGDITFEINWSLNEDKDTKFIRSLNIKNSRLNISVSGGEDDKIRDINKSLLFDRLNTNNAKWSFKISKEDFEDIRKLSNINSEKILDITLKNGNISVSESNAWSLNVDKVDEKDKNIIMNKKYLNSIDMNSEGNVIFHIFDNFMLNKIGDSNLMLSFEQSFNDEDDD
jgi:hypothetical protein